MQTMTYRNLIGSVEYCTDDELFFGKILHIDALFLYDAETLAELESAFHEAVDAYLSL